MSKQQSQHGAVWLILSYYANVDGLACSHHIDDRLPALQEQGIQPVVLSAPGSAKLTGFPHYRIFSLAPSGLRHEWRQFLKRRVHNRLAFQILQALVVLPLLPFYLLEKLLLPLDSTWSWMLSAPWPAVWLTLKYKPSVIYSTGGPPCAHVAAHITAWLTGVPYIAEFQDPLILEENVHPVVQRFRHYVERTVLKTSSALIFLTRNAAQEAVSRGLHPEKVTMVYPGSQRLEPSPVQQPGFDNKPFIVAHFGSLSGSRNLDTTLQALESLLAQHPELTQTLCLRLFGNLDGNVLSQIQAFSHREVIEIGGKVARPAALAAMQEADLLLLIQNSEDFSRLTIPSKVYEYLQMRRPLLALVYRNEELKTMLRDLGHAAVELEDVEEIKQQLLEMIESQRCGDALAFFPASPYTVESAAAQLIDLVARLRAAQFQDKADNA